MIYANAIKTITPEIVPKNEVWNNAAITSIRRSNNSIRTTSLPMRADNQ
jgi:hypothetical protein